jgi:hypothetical protein
VTRRAEEYRRYARQCLEIAPTFQDEEARATLLGLAQTWLRLAHLRVANRHIAELKSPHQPTANKKKAPAARPGLGWDLMDRTITGRPLFHNSATSENR